jgi:chemotaxis protein methyltransferase CheR
MENVEQLISRLRTERLSSLTDRVVEAMTINETFFFRDVTPFDALRDHILPSLSKLRSANQPLSLWCSACSSGQEPYSIAMTLLETGKFPPQATPPIMATDLCDDMLERAKSGNYSQFEVNRGLHARLLMKYFDRRGMSWVLRPEIRALVQFRKLNLATNWFFPVKYDIVFLRNVLIYFDEPTKKRIIERVHSVMKPDGYLVLGAGETLLSSSTPFRREEIGKAVFYRPAP